MSDLGKIFVYEKNLEHLQQYVSDFKSLGFFYFGTDNLFLLVQYAKEVNPDVIIINVSENDMLSNEDIEQIENTLCTSGCKNIYINQDTGKEHSPNFNYWEFGANEIFYKQILNIIKQVRDNKILH